MSEKDVKNVEDKNFNIDEALDKLEEINAKLSTEIPLNEALDLYKEGIILANKCKDNLEGIKAELKILNESN